MNRILFFVFLCTCWIQPYSSRASHPAHPSSIERGWSDAIRNRLQSMSAAERKEWKVNLRSELRRFKQKRPEGSADVSTLLLTLIALILPPLAVYLHQGTINSKFWISLLLTLLIWVPGVVYALLVIFGW